MDELPTMATAEPIVGVETVDVAETATPAVSTVSVSTPFITWEAGYTRRNLDVKLTGSQAATLKGIWHGLERQEATLANGKFVANPVDAIRWLLENVR